VSRTARNSLIAGLASAQDCVIRPASFGRAG
jgi:hypothetical protein